MGRRDGALRSVHRSRPAHSVEALSTPEQTGDRYSLRIVADPGGGPGIKGDGPHTHPGLIEIYRCVSGEMTTLFGKQLRQLNAGEGLEVPPAKVHGFVNSGNTTLVAEGDFVFPHQVHGAAQTC